MPLYVADYLGDTRRLTTLEHGAYLLLIFEYWRSGKLPNDDKRLARIVGLTDREWLKIRDSIEEFFLPGWRHKRIEKEIANSIEKSAKARASANARWSNADASTNALRKHSRRYAGAMLSQSDPESDKSLPSVGIGAACPEPPLAHSKGKVGIDPQRGPSDDDRQAAQAVGIDDDEFLPEWEHFRDHHLSKGSLMADWAAAWRSWLANHRKGTFAGRGKPSPIGQESNFTKAARKLLEEIEPNKILDLEPLPTESRLQ